MIFDVYFYTLNLITGRTEVPFKNKKQKRACLCIFVQVIL